MWGGDTLLLCSKRCSSEVSVMEGSTSLAKHSSPAGEGRICSQVWDVTVTSKSIKSFHLPKDTNARINMAAAELDWVHHLLWCCFLDCLVKLSYISWFKGYDENVLWGKQKGEILFNRYVGPLQSRADSVSCSNMHTFSNTSSNVLNIVTQTGSPEVCGILSWKMEF